MLKTFARSKTKSQRMHARVGRSMQRNCVCTVSLSGYLCKMPKWHQDTKARKEEHYDTDKLKRAKTKSQRMHAYISTAMCAWWSCSWRMRDCFCTAQVPSSPSARLLADLKARKTRKAGRLRQASLRDRKQQKGQRMHAHEELCADGQTWFAARAWESVWLPTLQYA
jgi:hypothetical protein